MSFIGVFGDQNGAFFYSKSFLEGFSLTSRKLTFVKVDKGLLLDIIFYEQFVSYTSGTANKDAK